MSICILNLETLLKPFRMNAVSSVRWQFTSFPAEKHLLEAFSNMIGSQSSINKPRLPLIVSCFFQTANLILALKYMLCKLHVDFRFVYTCIHYVRCKFITPFIPPSDSTDFFHINQIFFVVYQDDLLFVLYLETANVIWKVRKHVNKIRCFSLQ